MRKFLYGFILFVSISLVACGQENQDTDTNEEPLIQDSTKSKITFVELGSVNCIPCKMMQPVMEAVEEKYGEQLEVIFYDVWKQEQKKYAQEYGIRLIPTQVFLDENGNEFFRHEGFFAEEKIDSLLQSHGLKVLKGEKS